MCRNSAKAIAADLAAKWEPAISANGNRFQLNCPKDIGIIYCDKTKLAQSLGNLLSNAAKFTSNGIVTMTVAKKNGDYLIAVRDTGPGMRSGCRPECGRNYYRHNLRETNYIILCGEFNWLIDGLCGKALPAIDLAHVDLAGSQQRPEQHGSRVRRRQHGLRLDPALELLV